MFTERFIDLKEYELSELQDILASAMSELIMLRLESVQSNAERKKDMMIKLQKDLQKAHAYFERRTALCNTEDNIIKTFRYQDDEDRYREKDISVGDLCDYLGFDRNEVNCQALYFNCDKFVNEVIEERDFRDYFLE